MLATGLIVAYGYGMEAFMGWYSGNEFEEFLLINRLTGPYALHYWALLLCNILIPQLLWLRRVRNKVLLLWIISVIINIGMWLERFVIIVVSLHRDFLPSSWEMFFPTVWDWATFLGTIGLFTFFFALKRLPLADTVLIFQAHPLIVAMLAPWFLKERNRPLHWFLIIASVIGVFLVGVAVGAVSTWVALSSSGTAESVSADF